MGTVTGTPIDGVADPQGPGSVSDGPLAGTRHTLRLSRARWEAIVDVDPTRAIATVVGGWLVAAWGRFGIQGLSAPRVLVRFVLVGVYGWLLLTAVVWAVGWLAGRRAARSGVAPPTAPSAARILQLTGLCHQPLLVVAIAVQFGQLVPLPALFRILAVVAFGLWLPAMLVTALGSAFRPSTRGAIVAAGAGYLVWLATAGRYLLDRVGHLV